MAKTAAEYTRDWRARNKERDKENRQRWNTKNREAVNARSKRWATQNPIKALLRTAKQNARAQGVAYELTPELIACRLEPMVCEATGVELSWTEHACRPSIDRIDHKGGYVEDNIRMTTWLFNRARGGFTDEQLIELLARPLMKRVEG